MKKPERSLTPDEVRIAMQQMIQAIAWEDWPDALKKANQIHTAVTGMGFVHGTAFLKSGEAVFYASVIAKALADTKLGGGE
jgi:hypothetical protein